MDIKMPKNENPQSYTKHFMQPEITRMQCVEKRVKTGNKRLTEL